LKVLAILVNNANIAMALIGSIIINATALDTATGTRQAFSKSSGVITDTILMLVPGVGVGAVADQLEYIIKKVKENV
jgi:hypothetical protein